MTPNQALVALFGSACWNLAQFTVACYIVKAIFF